MPDSYCSFVFQHRYGKKWITYSDAELDILNNSLRKNRKTVALPSKDPKKNIVVNFENMTQRNKVSNFERRVRCLIYVNKFCAWMWKDEDDEFSSFRPFQIYFLEYAYVQDMKELKFFNFGDYTVNLRTLELIDEETNDIAQVMREVVQLNDTPKISSIMQENAALYMQMIANEEMKSHFSMRIFDFSIISKSTTPEDLSTSVISEVEVEEASNFVNKSVDPECLNAHLYKVYSVGDLYYGATLTYTNLENNINKYLIIQILVKKDKYFLWQRWARIGYKAQHSLTEFGSKLHEAVAKFEDLFFKKTKNKWQNVANFKQIPGNYDLLQMDLTPEEQANYVDVKSRLSAPVQDLLKLITSRTMMNDVMKSMNYDLVQAPLGKLSVSQIKEGYRALNKITELITHKSSGKDLISACDEFYTKIPHNFGRKKPPVISTLSDVDEKLKMLEMLLNIDIAVNIMNESSNFAQNPLDRYYLSLGCVLKQLDKESCEFIEISKNIKETHGVTHSDYEMELLEVFSCNKTTKTDFFYDVGNKFLLWHGSRLTNWIGILKEGLRIAPPEAPATGYMFGKGLYFADVCSKSANYCHASKNNDVGLLLLCEVSLGNHLDLYHSLDIINFYLPAGYDSIVGRGRWIPTNFEARIPSCDAQLPVGPIVSDVVTISPLLYNEYIVYNTKQVRMKYLVKVKFHFKS